ncbi:MAG TPA: DegT/DnrJ/EryC1/StrS family aminotransferase [Gammaproteobacteria bacterium]
MRERFLVFGAPWIERAEMDEVARVLESGWLGTGPRVQAFELAFAAFKGIDPAQTCAVASCTAALHSSLIAAGIGAGDEVITTPLTFCATVNAIVHAGATPVLADVDPVTMNLSPDALAERVGPRTRAIVPVHFAGRACDMDAIMRIARAHDLAVIEDCAHAIETTWLGRPAGTIGDFGCFSFYVTKNVVTGEGGMVTARRPEDAARIRSLALHGLSRDAWKRFGADGYRHYEVTECGFKYNMTDIQAALGIHQLARVEAGWRRRLEIWRAYDRAFADLPLGRPAPLDERSRHALHLYTLLIDDAAAGVSRDEFLAAMQRQNVGVGVHYLSVPEHAYYRRRFGWRPEDYPNAMRIGRQTASIPLSPALTDDDVHDVITAVRAAVLGTPLRRMISV